MPNVSFAEYVTPNTGLSEYIGIFDVREEMNRAIKKIEQDSNVLKDRVDTINQTRGDLLAYVNDFSIDTINTLQIMLNANEVYHSYILKKLKNIMEDMSDLEEEFLIYLSLPWYKKIFANKAKKEIFKKIKELKLKLEEAEND